MSDQSKTEPAFKLPRRPWWAAALVGGVGVGLAVLASLGLAGPSASAHEPTPLRGATFGPAPADDTAWRERMEKKLDDVIRTQAGQGERLANIEGRLGHK